MNSQEFRSVIPVYSLAGVILFLDQLTKFLVEIYMIRTGTTIPIIEQFDLLRLIYITNTGAAWGILKGYRLLFVSVALIVSGGCVWMIHQYRDHAIKYIAGAVLGGGLGNLIDRIFLSSGVVDFVDVGLGQYRWPAFNIADMALTVSMAVLLYFLFTDNLPSPTGEYENS